MQIKLWVNGVEQEWHVAPNETLLLLCVAMVIMV